MPGVSERTCIFYTSLVRQSREKCPNIGQVNPGLSSGGMAGWVFQEDINEGAPVKILRPKPIVKDVEDSKQLTGWRCRPAAWVQDDEIVVTSETGFRAAYCKRPNFPQLKVRRCTGTDDHELLAQAWQAASAKARELGWIT